MKLHQLKAPKGANRKRKRVARGEGSGHGKTAGRGGKGQTARTGKGKPRRGFEGGQIPMFRRQPKRGFVNIFRRRMAEVNVDTLCEHFERGAMVDLESVRKAGLAGGRDEGLRVLGRGDVKHALTIKAEHFSQSAKNKIEAAGGTAVMIAKPTAEAKAS